MFTPGVQSSGSVSATYDEARPVQRATVLAAAAEMASESLWSLAGEEKTRNVGPIKQTGEGEHLDVVLKNLGEWFSILSSFTHENVQVCVLGLVKLVYCSVKFSSVLFLCAFSLSASYSVWESVAALHLQPAGNYDGYWGFLS